MFNIIWILFSLSLKQTQMFNIQIPIFTLFFTQSKSQFLFIYYFFFFPFNFLGKKGNSRLHESRNCLTNRGTQILQIQKFSSHMLGDQGQVINTQEQIFFRNIVIRRKLKLKPSPFGIGTVGH